MKLNMGCGRHILKDWTNIDIKPAGRGADPDIICDLRKIPLPDGVAEEVMAIHVFEHFYLWEVPKLIMEWHRLLQMGGLLVLELPDLLKCCQNLLDGLDMQAGSKNPLQMGMWGLYGDPRDEDIFMMHRWGWSPESLRTFLSQYGFGDIKEAPTQWHGAGKLRRDMRIEAIKC